MPVFGLVQTTEVVHRTMGQRRKSNQLVAAECLAALLDVPDLLWRRA